jgi:cation diffusion facilitator family transporter
MQPSPSSQPADPARYQAAQRVTWVSVAVNVLLTALQIVVGILGKSQALVADGLHSLSDLLCDFLVLFANRHGSKAADDRHPYGHGRIETAATLALGIILLAVGLGLFWGAAQRLQGPVGFQKVHVATFWIALATLAAKEGLFRYMLHVARRLRSQMLEANAWHARSDAASSLVVVAGIGGNLAGFTALDAVAALLVSVMIVRMGWKQGYQALAELIDTSLDEEDVARIREALLTTPGVRGLHELRTRRMGDRALVDAHVLVDPRISVSEGHHIAEKARARLLERAEILDVMVHIDPEEDLLAKPSSHLPSRHELLAHLARRLNHTLPEPERIVLHYLGGRVEAEIFLSDTFFSSRDGVSALKTQIASALADDEYFSAVHLHRVHAP